MGNCGGIQVTRVGWGAFWFCQRGKYLICEDTLMVSVQESMYREEVGGSSLKRKHYIMRENKFWHTFQI